MENRTDTELLDMVRQGDHISYAALVERHYMTVYRYAYHWCRSREDAEDITQEVFIRLAGKIHLFDKRAKFTTWLYRMAANCAADYARKSRSWKKAKLPEPADYETAASPNPGPESSLLAKNILAAVDRLPEKQKEAVLLVYAEGLSHGEAARVLGCAEATVSWRIFQAKRRLKKVLS